MDLRQIEYFIAIASEQNITRAAKKLHISQPPLSRALMDLETELGCRLVIRGKRRLTLTPEGRAFKKRGEQLLTLTDITKMEIAEMKKGLSGTLYLGHVDSGGPTLAAKWIESFQKEYPNIKYNLWCGTVDDLTDRLKSGLIDVAILMSPRSSDLLGAVTVSSEHWVAIIPDNHPLAQVKENVNRGENAGLDNGACLDEHTGTGQKFSSDQDSILIKDLLGEDLIISSRKSREEEIRSWFQEYPGEPHFVVKTAHSSNAAKLVERNIGIALFPASVAGNIPDGSHVVVKKLIPEKKVDYLLSWDKERQPTAVASNFIEHVTGLI